MSEGKYGTGDILIAALVGVAVGAGVGILLAPKSGKETREQLSGYIREGKDIASRIPEALRHASAVARESLIGGVEKGV